MDKITTPMAVLISGVLIFIGLLILSNNLHEEYFYTEDRTSAGKVFNFRVSKETGHSCMAEGGLISLSTNKNRLGEVIWNCSDDLYPNLKK